MNKWIILDRDGTIIEEKHYLHDPSQVQLIPGVAEGLSNFVQHGFRLVAITNQSGIARGLFSIKEMNAVHSKIEDLLRPFQVKIEGWLFCPHLPQDNCTCRKPKNGLILEASLRYKFNINDIKAVIGDKRCDIELAESLHLTSVLLMSGYGQSEFHQGIRGTYNCQTIKEAAELIIASSNHLE